MFFRNFKSWFIPVVIEIIKLGSVMRSFRLVCFDWYNFLNLFDLLSIIVIIFFKEIVEYSWRFRTYSWENGSENSTGSSLKRLHLYCFTLVHWSCVYWKPIYDYVISFLNHWTHKVRIAYKSIIYHRFSFNPWLEALAFDTWTRNIFYSIPLYALFTSYCIFQLKLLRLCNNGASKLEFFCISWFNSCPTKCWLLVH